MFFLLKLVTLGGAYERGVQRVFDPLAGVFRGRSPLNGRGRIRTFVTIAGESVFETDAFGHSATLPESDGVRLPDHQKKGNAIST